MKISLLIITNNSRGSLSRLLQSIKNKIFYEKNLEIIFGIDEGDEDTKKIIDDLFKNTKIDCRFFWVSKSESSYWCDNCKKYHIKKTSKHSDILPRMCAMATGDIFWILNDDTEIVSDLYDKVIISEFEKLFEKVCVHNKSKMAMAGCREIRSARPGSKTEERYFYYYPLITREAYNTLGWFLPPTTGADVILWDIFKSSNAHDRVIDIPVFITDYNLPKNHDNSSMIDSTTHYGLDKQRYLEPISKINEVIDSYDVCELYSQMEVGFVCRKCRHKNSVNGRFASAPTHFLTCSNCHCPSVANPNIINLLQYKSGIDEQLNHYMKEENEKN